MVKAGKYQQWLEPEKLTLLEGWARDGLIDTEIAVRMGIAVRTLREWKTAHPEIGTALKKGKEVVDFGVENALLKRAMGYDYMEERVEIDCNGNQKTTQIMKHVPGEPVAMIFWLKNRRPDKWRDKPMPTAKGDEVTIIDDM